MDSRGGIRIQVDGLGERLGAEAKADGCSQSAFIRGLIIKEFERRDRQRKLDAEIAAAVVRNAAGSASH